MSFIDSIKEQLYQINEFNEALLAGTNLNELLLNQRAIIGESNSTTAKVNIIKTSDDTTKAEEVSVDPKIRLQNPPNTDNKIPVLYGRATTGGMLTDVAFWEDALPYEYDFDGSPDPADADYNPNFGEVTAAASLFQMCFTICMSTGNNIAGDPSEYSLKNVYFNNQKVNFGPDSNAVLSLTDNEGNTLSMITNKPADIVGPNDYSNLYISLFKGSASQIQEVGLESEFGYDARNEFFTWTPDHTMGPLIFALVSVVYNKELGLDRVPDVRFDIENSLSLPGDVLYDFMTNPIYGCGIGLDSIKATSI
jgi:hypothetical protein